MAVLAMTAYLLYVLNVPFIYASWIQPHDGRMNFFNITTDCGGSQIPQRAVIESRYTGNLSVFISYRHIVCQEGQVPYRYTLHSAYTLFAYFPKANTSCLTQVEECHFLGPDFITVDGVMKERYMVSLLYFWSDGYPGWIRVTCDKEDGFYQQAGGLVTECGGPDYEGQGSYESEGTTPEPESPLPEPETTRNDSDVTGVPEWSNSTSSPPSSTQSKPPTTDPPSTTELIPFPEWDGRSNEEDIPVYPPPRGNFIAPDAIVQLLPVNCSVGSDMGNNGEATLARMHIITDTRIRAFANCFQHRVGFTSEDTVNYFLDVFYNKSLTSEDVCVFRRFGEGSYTLRIEVWWGDSIYYAHSYTKDYRVTCIFSDIARAGSGVWSIQPGIVSDKDVVGGVLSSTSSVTLDIVNVLQRLITSRTIPLGRPIMLKGSSDGKQGELGLKVLSCDAVGAVQNQRYAVIRDGCGDGIIFPKDSGFYTRGLESTSPYFTMFAMSINQCIGFQCNFTLCDKQCDGSSCTNRIKRDAGTMSHVNYLVKTSYP